MSKKTKEKIEMSFVIYRSNWSDEMDISGCFTAAKDEIKRYFKNVETIIKKNGEYVHQVGTNQDITYMHISDFKNDFFIRNITDDEIKILDKFMLCDFGLFPHFSDVAELAADAESDEQY